jgi:hypothetical protein
MLKVFIGRTQFGKSQVRKEWMVGLCRGCRPCREFVDSPNRWFLGSWLSVAVKLREIVKEVLSATVERQ